MVSNSVRSIKFANWQFILSFNVPFILITLFGTVASALAFLKLARRFGLQDHPNGRSSHGSPTVTGMGVILIIAFTIYLFWQPYVLPEFFVLGFYLLTMISFLDDVYFLKHSLRLIFQVFAIFLMVYQLPFSTKGIEIIALGAAAIVFGIGVINAYNFMDGINGMLSLHSLLVLSCLLYLNLNLTNLQGNHIPFADSNFIVTVIIAMAVFGFFNIRKKAVAFIGDVGSIGIAFIILYLMYNLLLTSGNYIYLLLFSLFGADAGLTVCYKLILRENIFVPHRDFVFKKLVHLRKLSHLTVSFYFFIFQAALNLFIITVFRKTPKLSTQLSVLFIAVIGLITVYIALQSYLIRRKTTSVSTEA